MACMKPPARIDGDYYGVLKGKDSTYRLYLQYDNGKPALTVVGFRGYGVPVRSVESGSDSVKFIRQDGYSSFTGLYDAATNQIKGRWITEDSVSHVLTFGAVAPDTIKGLNPRRTKEYHYEIPPKANDQLDVADRSEHRVDQALLDGLVLAVMRKEFEYVHSILIARNDKLVMEEYFYDFPREAHFGIQSVTKSFVSALTGIAISKNEIPGVGVPVCNYLPQYRELLCNGQNKEITLHNLLTMSTGLEWDEITYEYGHDKNSSMIAANSGDELRYLLTRPRSTSDVFAYNSLNHTLMNHVLKESTKLDNSREIKERLLDPLGITEYDLGEMKAGVIGDIFLRPRDMLKFGLMYLNRGEWNGRQIVPRDWVEKSTAPKIASGPWLGYGYFWWTRDFHLNGRTIPGYFAWGYGGQYIFVVPELELVVVLTGTNWSTDPTKFSMEMMDKFVIPACR